MKKPEQRYALVTGGNGYIGRKVLEVLRKREYGYINLARRGVGSDPAESTDFRTIECDFAKWGSDQHKEHGEPDLCIHLAWENGFDHQHNSHYDNIITHYKFITKLIDLGVKNINIIGTAHEIGYYNGPVTEGTNTRPLNPYGIAKNFLRDAVFAYATNSDVRIKWLRVFYIYGDDERNNSIFTKILQAERDGKTEFPLNSGECLYDFIYLEELANQIVAAGFQTEKRGIINCCSGSPVSLRNMIQNFIELNDLEIRPVYGIFPERSYDSKAIWGDASMIRQILCIEDKKSIIDHLE